VGITRLVKKSAGYTTGPSTDTIRLSEFRLEPITSKFCSTDMEGTARMIPTLLSGMLIPVIYVAVILEVGEKPKMLLESNKISFQIFSQ